MTAPKTQTSLAKLPPKKKRILLLACLGLLCAIVALVLILVFALRDSGDNEDFPPDDPAVEAVTVTEWPSEDYPGVPVFDADSYSIIQYDRQTVITLDASYYDQLQAYAFAVADAGAATYLTSDYCAVYGLNNIEVQILFDQESPRIFLCREDQIDFSLAGYDAYPLPESGRLVSQVLQNDGLSAFLTYRNASFSDAVDYAAALERDGWVATDPAPSGTEPRPFIAVYTAGDLEITIDYHLASPDYIISFAESDTAVQLTEEELQELEELEPDDVDTNYDDAIDPDAAG